MSSFCLQSSFLKLILGELRPSSGEISVNGSISYASQEPWFFLGTLRDNILCSEVYDELQYRQLMEMCGLDQVFEILPKGDETVMLSDETKLTDEQLMKINLARFESFLVYLHFFEYTYSHSMILKFVLFAELFIEKQISIFWTKFSPFWTIKFSKPV